MCAQWAEKLPPTVRQSLLRRYFALLEVDKDIEAELPEAVRDTYFRAVGFQAQFLAHAGIIFLEGKDKASAQSVLDPLNRRFDEIEDGKWAGFWWDTIDDPAPPHRHRRFSFMHMMWPWNDAHNSKNLAVKNPWWGTAYNGGNEPQWLKPVVSTPANGGAWTRVPGLGTSGNALALLPVKPDVGEGATLAYNLCDSASLREKNLVIRFLPDFALWPGLKLRVKVQFDEEEAQIVEVPLSNGNISEAVPERLVLTQDNFVDVRLPIPPGAKTVRIIARDPGVVIDKVGIENTKGSLNCTSPVP